MCFSNYQTEKGESETYILLFRMEFPVKFFGMIHFEISKDTYVGNGM
jgi:hypothetical protein